MTNAKKAAIIAFVNAALAVAVTFGLPLSEVQIGALGVLINAGLGLYVALSYQNSPMRISEPKSNGYPDSLA